MTHLDLRHVISSIDNGVHGADQLLLPGYMHKQGDLKATVSKLRERNRLLDFDLKNKRRLKEPRVIYNLRLFVELHKYYLRFGQHQKRYKQLWDLYVEE